MTPGFGQYLAPVLALATTLGLSSCKTQENFEGLRLGLQPSEFATLVAKNHWEKVPSSPDGLDAYVAPRGDKLRRIEVGFEGGALTLFKLDYRRDACPPLKVAKREVTVSNQYWAFQCDLDESKRTLVYRYQGIEGCDVTEMDVQKPENSRVAKGMSLCFGSHPLDRIPPDQVPDVFEHPGMRDQPSFYK